jgi:nucleotide-binding universal stress UspA family protein
MGTHAQPEQSHPVVVGVSAGQSPQVVERAAEFAARFGAELVCAHVNPGRFATAESPDGSVLTAPLDPDFADEHDAAFDARIAAGLAELLEGSEIPWRTLALAGDVPTALAHLADTLDASMIIVGGHPHTLGGSIQDFFTGSVALALTRRQSRPVVVIPTHAGGDADALSGPVE